MRFCVECKLWNTWVIRHLCWAWIPEAHEKIKLEVLGVSLAALMWLKETFSTSVQLNCTLFFTIYCKGFTICTKSGTNIRTKFIGTINDFIPFLLWGKIIWDITSILSESMEIPFFEMICPNSFPYNTAKMLFFGFKEMSYFLQW